MRRLEEAKRAVLSDEASRELALASGAVASEFERQLRYEDAAFAWQLAVLFARDASDLELEQRARERFNAAAGAI